MRMDELHVEPGHYYKCGQCKGHFKATVTDEEARQEALLNGFTETQEDLVIICDDCYIQLKEWHDSNPRD